MKKLKSLKLGLLCLCLLTSVSQIAFAQSNSVNPNFFTTPPSPKITDAERQSELAGRRAAALKMMQPASAMILRSAEPRNYAGDVDFMYRQENNLYYLTNLRQKGSMLVLVKTADNQTQEILFLPKREPSRETWDGRMYSNEDAARISGIKTIVDSEKARDFLNAVRGKKMFEAGSVKVDFPSISNVYMLLPEDDGDGDGKAEFLIEQQFAATLKDYQIINARLGANDIFGTLRLVKSPLEIKILQHAIDITTEAQMRAMATAQNVKWEYETQAEIEYIFRKRNADYWGYPSIVGCGLNATTLHYVESQGAVKPGDLLLMDVGAEYDHYTADVTRTFPVSGKFSKEQAEIYQIVYDAQEAAAMMIKPGARFNQASGAAAEVIKKGLAKLGLITAPDAAYQIMFQGKPVNMPQYRLWYMHGWGHWLGMNVHDVGDYQRPFEPGMVTTNEPGIYIREDALDYLPDTPANREFLAKVKPVFQKYKNIGVRIEDDMLVTPTGVEWMTKRLPRTIADVEKFMAQNKMRFAALETKGGNPFVLNYSANLSREFEQFGLGNLAGKSLRKGWIHSGKNTALSGLAHNDSH